MKRGLGDSTLPQPEFVLARQQTVAERHPQFVVERTLVVVARVVLQDATHVRGVRNQVAMSRPDLEIGDVAEAMCGSQEHADRISLDRREHPDDRKSARSRRERG